MNRDLFEIMGIDTQLAHVRKVDCSDETRIVVTLEPTPEQRAEILSFWFTVDNAMRCAVCGEFDPCGHAGHAITTATL